MVIDDACSIAAKARHPWAMQAEFKTLYWKKNETRKTEKNVTTRALRERRTQPGPNCCSCCCCSCCCGSSSSSTDSFCCGPTPTGLLAYRLPINDSSGTSVDNVVIVQLYIQTAKPERHGGMADEVVNIKHRRSYSTVRAACSADDFQP